MYALNSLNITIISLLRNIRTFLTTIIVYKSYDKFRLDSVDLDLQIFECISSKGTRARLPLYLNGLLLCLSLHISHPSFVVSKCLIVLVGSLVRCLISSLLRCVYVIDLLAVPFLS